MTTTAHDVATGTGLEYRVAALKLGYTSPNV